MPMVYENLYLNTDESQKWNFDSFSPNIVSICLGTNDFSDGDGLHERHPFNADYFTSSYIRFVETIISHYPCAQIALLTSPMVRGEKRVLFRECLERVISHFETTDQKSIELFEFEEMEMHGCDFHPDVDDHMIMATQLIPFYMELLKRDE
jgi:hypothetical protein